MRTTEAGELDCISSHFENTSSLLETYQQDRAHNGSRSGRVGQQMLMRRCSLRGVKQRSKSLLMHCSNPKAMNGVWSERTRLSD